MARLSIIIPVYKVEAYINQCVASLVNQTWTDFELILVDDGSPDWCPMICDEWAKRDARIRVIHKDNGGPQSAVVAGIKAAESMYIGFVDGDDWVEADYFENLVSNMEQHDADLVVTGWTVHDGISEIRKKYYAELTILNHEDIQSVLADFWENGEKLLVENSRWNKIWRTDKLRKLAEKLDKKIKIGEDLEQILRYLTLCEKAVVIPQYAGYYYRENNTSLTRFFSDKMVDRQNELKQLLRRIAIEQGREYKSRESREAALTFQCLYQLYESRQTLSGSMRNAKKILATGEISIPNHISAVFRWGFAALQKGYYLFGTLYLKALFLLCGIIYRNAGN